jgi:hypothetical protein
MEKGFGQMMKGLFGSLSDEDKQKMKAACAKMAVMCPCVDMKNAPDATVKAMMESMKSFCGDNMEMMSACFKKASSTSKQKCCSEDR